MVKHIILWQIKDEYSEAEKDNIRKDVKSSLEGLMGKIPGMTEIKVNIESLPGSAGSNADMMLDSSFEDEAAFNAYLVFPEHVAIADEKIRPFVKARVCLDFEE